MFVFILVGKQAGDVHLRKFLFSRAIQHTQDTFGNFVLLGGED